MNHLKFHPIDYKNASYYGGMKESSRHGNGMLITDDSYILIANWNDNQIDGPYMYFFDGNFISGTSKAGKLQKFNLTITPSVKIFANYKNNLIHQKCIIQDDSGIKLLTFDNGKKIGAGTQLSFSKLKDTVWRQFGQEVLDIPQLIQKFLLKDQIKRNTKIRSSRISQNYHYFGALNEDGQCQNLGFILKMDTCSIYSCGFYKNGNLHGLGRTCQGESVIIDGVFKSGQFKGAGVIYNIKKNSYTIGNSTNPQDSKFGDPTRKIRQVRRQFHLRSLSFVNQMVIVSTIIKINFADITVDNLRSKQSYYMSVQNTSRAGNNNVSSYKMNVVAPQKYKRQKSVAFFENENDIIEYSSPIKQANSLFPNKPVAKISLDKQMRSISSMSKKSLLDNNFNKETKQLVKQLQEKNKRIDLHQIYKQTAINKAKKKQQIKQ